MNNFTSIDIDDIVKSSIDDLVKILKVKSKLYIGYDNKQNVAIAKICTAMNQIVYEKGYKRGKSVGSHQAYNHFVKHGHWEESKCLDDCFWVCSCCKFPSQAVAAPKLYKYCPNCGARMDGDGK